LDGDLPLVAILAIATLIDWALAALLVGVSGFILEGVNNTGPDMPAATLLIGFVVLCVAAPITAWLGRKRRWPPGLIAGLAYAPPVIAVVVLLAEPYFA
jgi:putative membrane protein (TIGR04086 family)